MSSLSPCLLVVIPFPAFYKSRPLSLPLSSGDPLSRLLQVMPSLSPAFYGSSPPPALYKSCPLSLPAF